MCLWIKANQKSLSDGVTKVFTVKNMTAYYKTPAFRMEFGLTISPLKRPLGAEGILILINWAGKPSNNEPCKQQNVTMEVEFCCSVVAKWAQNEESSFGWLQGCNQCSSVLTTEKVTDVRNTSPGNSIRFISQARSLRWKKTERTLIKPYLVNVSYMTILIVVCLTGHRGILIAKKLYCILNY